MKQATFIRRSTLQSLSLQLVFPDISLYCQKSSKKFVHKWGQAGNELKMTSVSALVRLSFQASLASYDLIQTERPKFFVGSVKVVLFIFNARKSKGKRRKEAKEGPKLK
jgi:hypothetical protein